MSGTRRMDVVCTLGLLLCLLSVCVTCEGSADAEPAAASVQAAGVQAAEAFTAPVLRRRLQRGFLENDHRTGLDGWVELSLMVDADGSTYEVVVAESSGNNKLESAAVMWMKQQRFVPARLNGVAVDARHGYRVSKSSIPTTGVSDSFSRNYNQTLEANERGDQAAADASLERLDARTLAEQRASKLVRYKYLVRWGSKQQQLDALKAWVADNSAYDVRPAYSDSFTPVWSTLFQLQLDVGDYGGALQTYERMSSEAKLSPATVGVRTRLDQLAADQRAFAVEGQIADRGSWFLRLLKRRFSVDVLAGAVAELKVRCERKFVQLSYQPGMHFTITPGYGACDLEVLGKPGTKFKLTQS